MTETKIYCGVIERHLATDTCPLPKYSCLWCHKKTKQCTYDDAIAHPEEERNRLTPDEFAVRVGLPPIPLPLVNILKQSLVINLKKSV
jgi:hypothetical protein